MSGHLLIDIETISQDPAKIMAGLPPWLEEEARERMPKNYSKKETQNEWLERDLANYGKDVLEKAALHAETANIAVIGLFRNGKVEQLYFSTEPIPVSDVNAHVFRSEAELLEHAFMRLNEGALKIPHPMSWEESPKAPDLVMAWNMSFEVAMLVKRAWILGVPVPKGIFNPASRYPVPDRFLCLMKAWQAGDFKAPFTGLNAALKQTGLGEKTGSGADFGKLWSTDKAEALEYNRQDLICEAKLAERMGLL